MIHASDLHFDDQVPKAVELEPDPWIDLQLEVLDWLLTLAEKEPDPALGIAGDLFNRALVRRRLVNLMLEVFHAHPSVRTFVVPGQHDTLYHQLANHMDTSLATLALGAPLLLGLEPCSLLGRVHLGAGPDWEVWGCPWGGEPLAQGPRRGPRMLLWHVLVSNSKQDQFETMSPVRALQLAQGFDLIHTGDNHRPFTHAFHHTQVLINPGSLLGTKADQQGFIGAAFRSYIDERGRVALDCVPTGVTVPISRQHIEQARLLDANIQAFAASLQQVADQTQGGEPLFHQELWRYCRDNKVPPAVQAVLKEAFGGTT